VPVLEKVAAIFRPMMPDLPMPVTISGRAAGDETRGFDEAIVDRSASARTAAASVWSTLRARDSQSSDFAILSSATSRRSSGSSRSSLSAFRVALGTSRILVDFHEDASTPAATPARASGSMYCARPWSPLRRPRAAAGCA
jgi:hypothetical protein